MQLEQQESFEIKGPQLEVFGEAETRLPAAAKKRPAALAVLAVAIVASVLGIQPQQSVEMFLGGLPGRFRPASGPCKAQGALFTLDSATGLCTAVERVDIR